METTIASADNTLISINNIEISTFSVIVLKIEATYSNKIIVNGITIKHEITTPLLILKVNAEANVTKADIEIDNKNSTK